MESPWEPCSGFSSETLLSPCCHLPPPPVEARCCLFGSQDMSSRRHKQGISPLWALCSQPPARKEAIAGSAPGRGILAALLSLGRPGDVPCVWPASPGPAAQSFCHKSTAPPVLRPAATSQKANVTSTLSPVLCSLPDISPPLHLPKAFLSEGSERCRLHFSSPLKNSVLTALF